MGKYLEKTTNELPGGFANKFFKQNSQNPKPSPPTRSSATVTSGKIPGAEFCHQIWNFEITNFDMPTRFYIFPVKV